MNNILKTKQKEYFIKIIFSSNAFSCYYFVAGGYHSINEIKSNIQDQKANADKGKDDNDMLEIKGEINKIQFGLADIKLFWKNKNQQKQYRLCSMFIAIM